MLKGEPFLKDYLLQYSWVTQIYVYYYRDVYRKNMNELEIDRLSKKTIHL